MTSSRCRHWCSAAAAERSRVASTCATPIARRWRTCTSRCSTARASPPTRSATAPACSRNSRRTMMTGVLLGLLLAASPLVDAAKAGDRAAAFALIDQRVDVNAAEADGTTALHWAVHNNDLELVQRLIRAGADVKAKNDYGATPMSEAAVVANAALIDALLTGGADVESPNADGQTALMVVARTSEVAAARMLLTRGANVNAVEKWRGQTALMWAAAQSQPAMVRALIAAGADVNARATVNNWGQIGRAHV